MNDPTIGVTIKCPIGHRARVITDEELQRLFAAFRNIEHQLVVRLAFFTGARISTIYALTPDSLQGNRIYYQNVKCKKQYDYSIPVTDKDTIELYKIVGRKGFMWSTTINSMKSCIDRRMETLFGKDAKGEHLSIHSLRHSFATRAIQRGVPPEIVAKMLDHSSINTTLTFYAKHSQQQIDDAMDRVFEKQKNPES